VFGTLDAVFAPSAVLYWTGLQSDWTTYPAIGGDNQNCNGWSYNTSQSSPFGTFGLGGYTDSHAIYQSHNAYCDQQQYHLVCVEQ
jgi:hypothetical protein